MESACPVATAFNVVTDHFDLSQDSAHIRRYYCVVNFAALVIVVVAIAAIVTVVAVDAAVTAEIRALLPCVRVFFCCELTQSYVTVVAASFSHGTVKREGRTRRFVVTLQS